MTVSAFSQAENLIEPKQFGVCLQKRINILFTSEAKNPLKKLRPMLEKLVLQAQNLRQKF